MSNRIQITFYNCSLGFSMKCHVVHTLNFICIWLNNSSRYQYIFNLLLPSVLGHLQFPRCYHCSPILHLKYFYSGQMSYTIAEEKNSCQHANQKQTSEVKH